MNDEKLLKAAKLILGLLDAGESITDGSGTFLHRPNEDFGERMDEFRAEVREDPDLFGVMASLMNGSQVLAQAIHTGIGKDYVSELLRADMAAQEHRG